MYTFTNSFLGLVAQWTRARGYEPRCRGFESLLAQIFNKFYPSSNFSNWRTCKKKKNKYFSGPQIWVLRNLRNYNPKTIFLGSENVRIKLSHFHFISVEIVKKLNFFEKDPFSIFRDCTKTEIFGSNSFLKTEIFEANFNKLKQF